MKAVYSIAKLKRMVGNFGSVSIIMPGHRNVESEFIQKERK